MGRPYKRVVLSIKEVPPSVGGQVAARCPSCEGPESTLLGRIGLRFVFRCPTCKVDFFRQRPTANVQFI